MIIESDIVDAIKANQLTFFYQPKISLISGKVIGAEALIRWIKPDGTIIMPDSFIPVAERSSLIKNITQHMFPKLMNDLLLLSDIDKLTYSFNATARDFEDDTFSKMMLNSLEASQLPSKHLQIELTETALLDAGHNIIKNIHSLSDAGVGLAMDDFSRGYSSIDTLSKWPFDTIKLDHGIISRMLDSEKNSTIIESTIRMAHELGMSVVAEGVETNDQYHHLLASGCTKVQGFWISKPLPLSEFITFVEQDIRWSGLPIGLIHMAIIDHIQWRKQLVSELTRVCALPTDAPQRKLLNTPPLSCKHCRLGLWYYKEGQTFAHRQSFQEVEKPHQAFHEVGVRLTQLVADGAKMDALMPELRLLSEYSMEIMGKLQTLENEGLQDMHAAHQAWNAHSFNQNF